MKKLLLYLMTLLVFGAVPVDSFATEYLIIPTAENGWDVSYTDEGAYAGYSASLSNVKIGNGKFAIGVYNDATGKVQWYKRSGTSQVVSDGVGVTCVANGTTVTYNANGTGMKANDPEIAVLSVGGASSGDVYSVTYNKQTKRLTLEADYSNIKFGYQAANTNGGNAFTDKLEYSADAIFEVNPGDNNYFLVWFESPDGSVKSVFDANGLTYEDSDGAGTFSYTADELVATSNLNTAAKITVPDKQTYYRVYVNYRDKMITVTKIPVQLYIIGGADGNAWNDFTSAGRRFQTQPDPESPDTGGLLYVTTTYLTNGWYGINVGTDRGQDTREFLYCLQASGDKDLKQEDLNNWLDLVKTTESGAIHVTTAAGKYSIKIKLDENNKPSKIWFETGDYIEDTNYAGYIMTTHYGQDGSRFSHTTQDIRFVEDNPEDGTGHWEAIDRGNSTKEIDLNVIYDGLRLGYDNFCLQTIASDGTERYWGLKSDIGGFDVKVDQSITMELTPFLTKEAALANTYIKPTSEGLINSRYDIKWNFNTNELTLSLNDVWMNAPNQMYLYRLSDEEIAAGVDKTNMLSKVRAAVAQNSPNVFVLDYTQDGIYETVFSEDDREDLPKGTRFCIVGRTGTVYNILNENQNDGSAFSFGDDWDQGTKSYRKILTTSDSQAPARVNTDQIANSNTVVRVRANYSGTNNNGEDFVNNYLITFEQQGDIPVKFVMYTQGHIENGVDLTKTDAKGVYTLTNTTMSPNTKYMFYSVDKNGTSTLYKPKTYSDLGYRSVNVGGNTIDEEIEVATDNEDKSKGGFWINDGNNQLSGVTVKVLWNNGFPQLVVAPDGEAKTVRVFFVNRAGWDNIHSYCYSDLGVAPTYDNDGNADWSDAKASVRNEDWPGVAMQRGGSGDGQCQAIAKALNVEQNKVWWLDIDVRVFEDGNYNMPKIIFNNNNNKQTYNLYLVDGGIYSNAQGSMASTEYLPRMQYTYFMTDSRDRQVEVYGDTEYNTIYCDDPELIKWAADSDSSHEVAISITYDRSDDGKKDYEALGIPGNHKMILTEVDGKQVLRCQISEYIIPDDTEINLNIWPLKKSDSNSDYNFSDGSSNHDSRTSCVWEGTTYTGDHLYCNNSLCSLNFTNVQFSNGNVYRRFIDTNGNEQNPVTTIDVISAPKKVYLVTNQPVSATSGPYQSAVAQEALGAKESINGLTGNWGAYELKMMDTREPEAVRYIIPEVLPSASFYFLALRQDDTYKFFSGENATEMTPNVFYTYEFDKRNNYTIKHNYVSPSYEIRMTWTDNDVVAVANKADAHFRFAEWVENGDDRKLVTRTGWAMMLPTHAESCDEYHLTKIYFTYAPGYDNDITEDEVSLANCRLSKLKVSYTRDLSYDKYFPAFTSNSPAHVVTRENKVNDEPFFANNIAIERKSNLATNEPGLAYIYVKAYTASQGTLAIEQIQSDDAFARSKVSIPLRFYPTIEGIGMTINNVPVKYVDGGYSVSIADSKHVDGGNGSEFGDRLQFQALEADHQLHGQPILHYYWSMAPTTTTHDQPARTQKRAISVVENHNKSQLIQNVDQEPFNNVTDEYNQTPSEFSIYNAPSIPVGQKANKDVYLQLEQNGIKSPLYTVNVTRDNAELTEVEEILDGTEDVAPVYYNLNGVRVDAERLEPGIYVKVTGTKSEKVYVK